MILNKSCQDEKLIYVIVTTNALQKKVISSIPQKVSVQNRIVPLANFTLTIQTKDLSLKGDINHMHSHMTS